MTSFSASLGRHLTRRPVTNGQRSGPSQDPGHLTLITIKLETVPFEPGAAGTVRRTLQAFGDRLPRVASDLFGVTRGYPRSRRRSSAASPTSKAAATAASATPKPPARQLPFTSPPNRTCQAPKRNAPANAAASAPAMRIAARWPGLPVDQECHELLAEARRRGQVAAHRPPARSAGQRSTPCAGRGSQRIGRSSR